MPKYLFSNDQRISALAERIQWVSKYVLSGKMLKDISGKSDNNNAATLEFYYNLYPNTKNTEVAVTSPQEVIRNFVLKFQFPNTRTQESFNDSLTEGVYLAPFRMVVSILVSLAKISETNTSYLSLEEILYYVFTDCDVCKNPSIDCDRLAASIVSDRNNHKDLSSVVSANLEWKHYDRQVREMMAVLCKCSNCFQISKGVLLYAYQECDEKFVNELVSYSYFWTPTNENDFELSNKEYISYMNIADTPYNVVEFTKDKDIAKKVMKCDEALQQIFYGAPGTGKSHTIKEQTKGENVIRTTFHPDSDYSTFVGAYKPTTITVPVTTVIGTKAVTVEAEDGTPMKEDKIVYEFVSQAFLQAYVEAWKKYCEIKLGEEPKKEFLVIEEINRGNCAQIFGDLFQLLDRGEHGFSEYPIKADADMKKQIEKAFKGKNLLDEKKNEINALYEGEKDIVSQVLHGEILLLPNNLYIWATMNTSDQSLFPIDSAFKRRWDWQYVPICDARKNWKIAVNGKLYDWWLFVEAINHDIYEATFSEDKKLGYFFCKADDGIINADKFVSKVIFYLWNDVFKDTEFDGEIFKDTDGSKLSFDKFYRDMKGKIEVNEEKVDLFLQNLKLSPISDTNE